MRRTASEIIRNLETRIARLERSAVIYNPNDLFKIEKGKGFIRIYVGGKYNNKRTISSIKETFKSCFIYHFIPSNGLPPYNFVDDLVENAFDRSSLIEELSRVRIGEKAIQFNLYNSDNFLKAVIKEFEMNLDDDLDYVLDWADEYETDTAIKEAVKELMDKYGKVEPNKIDPRTYRLAGKTRRRVPRDIFRRPSRNIMPRDLDKVRSKAIPPNAYDDIPFSGGQHDFYGALHELVEDGFESDQIVKKLTRRFKVKAPFILEQLRRFYGDVMRVASTRKVAGHIVLAGTVNVEELRSELSSTFGVEDIDFDDGVLSFLMDKKRYPKVEKEVKQVAKDFKVKFEKGEFTDGLGMIYTSSRRR